MEILNTVGVYKRKLLRGNYTHFVIITMIFSWISLWIRKEMNNSWYIYQVIISEAIDKFDKIVIGVKFNM